MSIEYNKNGIKIKKLFKSREISYNEIRSVIKTETGYIITTKEGEVINDKERIFCDYTELYCSYKKYNIYFKDEEEINSIQQMYSIEKIYDEAKEMQSIVMEYMGKRIQEKYGPEYGLELSIKDEGIFVCLFLKLTKNGEVVKDISKELTLEFSNREPDSFDDMVIAFLVEWDGCGKYGVTKELTQRKECEEYLNFVLNNLYEVYEGNK